MDLNARIRLATSEDLGALRQALAAAIDWRVTTSEVSPQRIEETGHGYLLADWGRAGDAAFVAEQGEKALGAAWYRLWTESVHSHGFVDPQTPELGVGVHSHFRGRGLGSSLLIHLLDHARDSGVEAVSLSVEIGNPAIHLYERLGFQPHARMGNALTLLKSLRE